MSDELKPCPMCGSTNIHTAFRSESRSVSWDDGLGSPSPMISTWYQAFCYECGASITGSKKPEAIAAWNRRADDD